jgi:hypothetical protein
VPEDRCTTQKVFNFLSFLWKASVRLHKFLVFVFHLDVHKVSRDCPTCLTYARSFFLHSMCTYGSFLVRDLLSAIMKAMPHVQVKLGKESSRLFVSYVLVFQKRKKEKREEHVDHIMRESGSVP